MARPSKIEPFIEQAEKVLFQDINAIILTDEELVDEVNEGLKEKERITQRTFINWKANAVKGDETDEIGVRLKNLLDVWYKKIGKTKKRKLPIKYISQSQYYKELYHYDSKQNIRIRISSQVNYHLKNKSNGCFRHLPYSVNELKDNLESKFLKGMSWDNMSDWHIDHIIPVSLFNFTSVNDMEFKQCYSLDNLQPLWAKDNIKKSNTLGYNQISIGL